MCKSLAVTQCVHSGQSHQHAFLMQTHKKDVRANRVMKEESKFFSTSIGKINAAKLIQAIIIGSFAIAFLTVKLLVNNEMDKSHGKLSYLRGRPSFCPHRRPGRFLRGMSLAQATSRPSSQGSRTWVRRHGVASARAWRIAGLLLQQMCGFSSFKASTGL